MAQGCPPPDVLEAYAKGSLEPAAQASLEAHALGCAECGPRIHVSPPTQLDSPKAVARRQSHPQVPAVELHDTLASPRRSPPRPTAGERPRLPRGSALGRYLVLEHLGSGGMGDVYTAYDPNLDRKVAVKLLRGDLHQTPDAGEHRARLVREAQAMGRLAHPNVVAVHEAGVVNGQVFVAMELVDGVTVGHWLHVTPRSWRAVLDVFLDAGKGLAAAHAAGLVHRDFKPDNVILGRDRRVRVMDFGLATSGEAPAPVAPELSESGPSSLAQKLTVPGTIMGTPAYMSPEQLLSKAIDGRSDQFSFCVALYEALYDERPFAGDHAGAILRSIQAGEVKPAPIGTLVPTRIRKLLLKGLQFHPDQRFRSMNALLLNLARRKSAVRRQWSLVAGVTAVVVTLGGAFGLAALASDRCRAVADRFDGVWDASVKDRTREAFLATERPWAAQAWKQAAQSLDAYVGRWVSQRRAVCEAYAGAPEEPLAQQIVCLGRRHAQVAALSAQFLKADPAVVERAVLSVEALPSLESCGAIGAAPPTLAPVEEERLTEAQALLDLGKYADARAKADALLQPTEPSPPVAAEALLLSGLGSARGGEPASAETKLDRAIHLAEVHHLDELAARARVERAAVAVVRAPNEPLTEMLLASAATAIERLGGHGELSATLESLHGARALARGQADAAATHYRSVLRAREQTLGARHPLVARSWSNLGIALKAQGQLDEAIAAYRQAQAIEEAILSPEHPAVADTLNNLANAHVAQGDLASAIAEHARALTLKRAAFGETSMPVAVTLSNLGSAWLEGAQPGQALRVLEHSLALKQKLAGPRALTVAVTLGNLARAHRALGAEVEAGLLDQRALEVREATQGPSHPDLAVNLRGVAHSAIALRHEPEARAALDRLAKLLPDDAEVASLRAELDLLPAHGRAKPKRR